MDKKELIQVFEEIKSLCTEAFWRSKKIKEICNETIKKLKTDSKIYKPVKKTEIWKRG